MWKYIFKRLLMLIPVIIGVSFIIFFIVNLAPGDPARIIAGKEADDQTIARIREELGLNDNIFIRYGRYMLGLLQGDLGKSYYNDRTVLESYLERLPATMWLAFWVILMALFISLPLGIIAAIRQYSIFDNLSMVVALTAISIPDFWLGILLILFFSLILGWLPSGGNAYWYSVLLPAASIGTQMVALLTRMTRSSMLEVIRQDYIITARAKGLTEIKVVMKHALKNAMIPISTTAGNFFVDMVGGAVIAETIFSWPGIGRLIVDSINKRDLPMVIGCIILTTIIICVVNLIIDVAYAFIDPRLKATFGTKK